MAYDFTSASSQYLTIPNTNVPWGSMANLTLHARVNLKNFTTAWRIVAMDDGTSECQISSSLTTGIAYASSVGSAGGLSDDIAGVTMSANTWYNLTGVFTPNAASGISQKFFCDTTKYTSKTSGGFARPGTDASNIHICHRVSPASYVDGRIAEIAAWDVQLDDDECVALGKGHNPKLIRPSSLVLYVPSVRDLKDYSGGVSITNVNSAVPYDHPRIYGG